MKTLPRISFIVPTFNRARYLGEALGSIIPQMAADDELLVIDDGSTDGTAEVLSGLGPKVRTMRQANAGKAVALNRGLAETSGRYVWICDDDDVLRPNAVSRLVKALESSEAGFAFGRYTRFSNGADGGRQDLGTGYWPDLTGGSLTRHILEDAFVMQNAALVRREVYNAVGPFAEAMPRSLDYEMFARLAVACPSIYVDRVLFDQRKHEGVRGPAALLHAASQSDNVWHEYDRRIFENLYAHAPLAHFEAMFACDDPALRRRAALLQRAAIMARHACWAEAIADIGSAAAIPGALDPGEISICRRALAGKHLFASLPGSIHEAALRRLATGATGREIVTQMFAGTLWRIRRGSTQERRVTLAAMRGVLGLARTAQLIAFRGEGPARPVEVREVTDLPRTAYLAPSIVPPVGQACTRSAA